MQATTNVYVKDSSRTKRHKPSLSSRLPENMNIPEELAELIKEEHEHKSYSGGVLAILVICILLGIIGLVTYLTMEKSEKNENLMPVYFSDIFKVSSLITNFEYEWKNGNFVFKNSSGHFYVIKLGHYSTAAFIILQKERYSSGMSISSDLTMWIVPDLQRQTDDFEYEYTYKLIQTTPVTFYSRLINLEGEQNTFFRSISWGPKSKYMAAIYGSNIYYSLNPQESSSFICISCHMNPARLYGQFIGYYKEKIFKNTKAYWWNNNGQFLGFLSFINGKHKKSNVESNKWDAINIRNLNNSYNQLGSTQPFLELELHAINLASQKLYSINLQNYVPFKSFYIIHVQWYNSTFLLINAISNDQMKIVILLCEIMKTNCFKVFEKLSKDWININEYQNVLIDDANEYLYIAMTVTECPNNRKQVAKIKINRSKNNMLTWLDLVDHEVIKLNYFDGATESLYYSAFNKNVSDIHLYRFLKKSTTITCESCKFTTCYRNDVHFPDTFVSFLHRCLGPKPEKYQLIQRLGDDYRTEVLETNHELLKYLQNKSLSKEEYVQLDISDENRKYSVSTKISYPRQLNPDHVTKYPVLVILFDSLSKNSINDDFSVGWVDYVTGYLQYVVIELKVKTSLNCRALTNISSWKFRNRNLMLVKETMKELMKRKLYMDNSSVGIIGENYEAYLTARLMTDSKEFPDFRCAVAVNPIDDFTSSDSFFAKRNFGQYSSHNRFYEDSMLQAPTLIKKDFLLIINANENIFTQNSAKFIKNLVEKNSVFDFLLMYNQKNKSSKWNTNKYMLKKITKFFVNCFNRSSVRYSILENDILHSL